MKRAKIGSGRFGGLRQGADLTPEQVEFGRACDDEKRILRRSLTARDVLEVAKRLGYAKGKA